MRSSACDTLTGLCARLLRPRPDRRLAARWSRCHSAQRGNDEELRERLGAYSAGICRLTSSCSGSYLVGRKPLKAHIKAVPKTRTTSGGPSAGTANLPNAVSNDGFLVHSIP